MPDIPLTEDQATLYVLGELTASERCEFEARLAESAELCALVRELEEGALASAMASPQRRVPQKVWERIEKAVTEETKPRLMDFSLWFGWLRNGWAVAAACVVGWLLYAFWVDRPGASVVLRTRVASVTNSQPESTATISERTETATARRETRAQTGALLQLFQSKTQEIGALRGQIVQLTNAVRQLSEAVDQQQALLSEPDRLKFFQLVPGAEGGAGGSSAPVSPALQRALFLAMARELGWLGSPGSIQSGSAQTNPGGVDFVDLRAGSNHTANLPSQTSSESSDTSQSSTPVVSPSSNTIPGFVSGTNAFVAVDSSVVPPGSMLAFGNLTSDGSQQPYGQVNFYQNPTVVAFPLSSSTAVSGGGGGGAGGTVCFNGGGMNVFVIAPGWSNAIPYLLPAPGLTPP